MYYLTTEMEIKIVFLCHFKKTSKICYIVKNINQKQL
jgi:hypothetical protein